MELRDNPIFFLSGYQGAGKDALASHLVRRCGFENIHSIWWIKEQAATALAQRMPEYMVEWFVSSDHVLKEVPLPFAPFDGLSSRAWQKREGKRYGWADKVDKMLVEKLLPRKSPLVITGMRGDARHEMMRQRVREHGLPAQFVWVTCDVMPPLAEGEKAADLYPPEAWFDRVIVRRSDDRSALWRQTEDAYPWLGR